MKGFKNWPIIEKKLLPQKSPDLLARESLSLNAFHFISVRCRCWNSTNAPRCRINFQKSFSTCWYACWLPYFSTSLHHLCLENYRLGIKRKSKNGRNISYTSYHPKPSRLPEGHQRLGIIICRVNFLVFSGTCYHLLLEWFIHKVSKRAQNYWI